MVKWTHVLPVHCCTKVRSGMTVKLPIEGFFVVNGGGGGAVVVEEVRCQLGGKGKFQVSTSID